MLGKEKGELAIPFLAKGWADSKVAEKLGTTRQSVYYFRKKPETQAILEEIKRNTYARVALQGSSLLGKAMTNLGRLMKSDDESIALRASVEVLGRLGFATGQKIELGGAVGSFKIDMSKLPRELLDRYADGEGGDDLDIPEGLLDEAMAQGEQ